MRRVFSPVLLLAAWVAGGCMSVPAPLATAPVVQSVVRAPASAVPLASPTSPPSIAAYPTAGALSVMPVPQTTAATPVPGSTTFSSKRLGIEFEYAPMTGDQKVGVREIGDKVFLYVGQLPPEAGQYVRVYRKAPGETLEAAITRQVLQGYSSADCLVRESESPERGLGWPASYTFAVIGLAGPPEQDMEALQARARKCPQPYAALGGIAYFVADAGHPERFLFLNIGQYYIPSGLGERPWQNTIRFLD